MIPPRCATARPHWVASLIRELDRVRGSTCAADFRDRLNWNLSRSVAIAEKTLPEHGITTGNQRIAITHAQQGDTPQCTHRF
jgi:hypothetical protein